MAPSALSIPPSREAPTMPVPSVATILRDHVSLSTSCIDRLYLNGYVPKLQTSGQLCAFLCDHLGNRIASPAAFRPLHDRFVQDVTVCSPSAGAIVQFERGQRKDDVAARYRGRFRADEGVVFIGVAQERCSRSSHQAQRRYRTQRPSVVSCILPPGVMRAGRTTDKSGGSARA